MEKRAKRNIIRQANVFSGSYAIRNYLDPRMHAPTSLVELPVGTRANPFPPKMKVRIFIKVMGELPGNTLKLVPVAAWYKQQMRAGKINRKTVVVINSSGGAGLAAVMVGGAMGVKEVRVYMPKDTPPAKQNLIREAGGIPILTQDIPGRPTSVQKIRKMTSRRHIVVFDQYGKDINWKSHMRVTMKQIWDQMALLGSFPGVVVAAKGTTGTVVSAREYAKKMGSKTIVVGVESSEGEPIPAVRPSSRLGSDQILFDHATGIRKVTVKRYETYWTTINSLFKRAGLKVGLSSGAALYGGIEATKQILADPNTSVRDKHGFCNVVVIAGDILDPYLDQLRVILDSHDL